ncbi:MAG: regulatory protein RecX [Candidatus Eisenbacteria bacterium]
MSGAKGPTTEPQSGREACRASALRMLARRERTCRGLRDALLRRYPAEEADAVVSALRSEGLVDDRRFARLFVEAAIRHKPQSSRSLEAKLVQRGCDRTLIAEVLREAQGTVPGFDELELARRLVRKRLRAAGNDRDKILRALARQGFNRAIALRAWESSDIAEGD